MLWDVRRVGVLQSDVAVVPDVVSFRAGGEADVCHMEGHLFRIFATVKESHGLRAILEGLGPDLEWPDSRDAVALLPKRSWSMAMTRGW